MGSRSPKPEEIRTPRVEIVDPVRDAARARLNFLAWVLDGAIQIPGTQIRFGFDALIGLLPGFGDAIGAILSSYILGEAAALGAPKSTLIRMSFNIAVDAVVGVVPFVGDAMDVAWKANLRNVNLLNDWLDEPRKTSRTSRLFVGALIAAVLLFVIGLGVLAVWLFWWLIAPLLHP
jgi:hypothetical protein